MNKQSLITVSMAALLFSAASPLAAVNAQTGKALAASQLQAITIDQVIEEIGKKQPVPLYLEATLTAKKTEKNREITIVKQAKTWDNAAKGEWRQTVTDGKKVKHTVGKAGQVTEYQEGGRALEYAAKVVPYHSQITKAKRELQRLKAAAPGAKTAIAVKEETLLTRAVYYITKTEELTIEGMAHTYADELWLDKESGVLLKRTYTHNNAPVFQYAVDKIDLKPVFDDKTFVLDLPAQIKPSTFPQGLEKSLADLVKLMPELEQYNDFDDLGVEGDLHLVKMYEVQEDIYNGFAPRSEAIVAFDLRTGTLNKAMFFSLDWPSDQRPADKLAKEKAEAFLKQLFGDQAANYKAAEKVEESGIGTIVEDKEFNWATADVTFHPQNDPKGKSITISVDKAGHVVGLAYSI
ncbi:hypothetical protein [Brevibacillus borstelensis]|uniref:hypothetical protein n=1 Tax=Brevibacillus borstelensis TaxID=45462 RepID=UPI0030C2AD95